MSQISIMHGAAGQTVKTVTETGADGAEHTTRTVTNADEQSSKGSNDGDDLMNAIMAPLMGGMPDIERIMQDVESGQESSAPKVEEPSAPKVEAATFVSKDEATQAVKTAISAKGLAFDSPQKRQELAASIAAQLGVNPDAVKVSAQGEDADLETDDDDTVDMEAAEATDNTDDDSEDTDEEDADATSTQDADEFGKEFDAEEQDKETVLRREANTIAKVEEAADQALVKAKKQEQLADHFETLAQHMHMTATNVA